MPSKIRLTKFFSKATFSYKIRLKFWKFENLKFWKVDGFKENEGYIQFQLNENTCGDPIIKNLNSSNIHGFNRLEDSRCYIS